jgi:hypothetical protein
MVRARGFLKIIVVSDCLSIIQRISSTGRDRSEIGVVISNIKKVAMNFQSCLFKFYSHTVNVVAHKLAWTAEPLVCLFSVNVIPDIIRGKLCNDILDQ